MAVGINSRCPIEDVEVIEGEVWVVMQLGFEEVKEDGGGEREGEVGGKVVREVVGVAGGGKG